MTGLSSIYEIVRENGQRTPQKTALVLGENRLTYGEVLALVEKLTRALHGASITKGTHFALAAHNSMEFALLMLAAAKLGAVIVPLPPGVKGAGSSTAVKVAECSHLIAPEQVCAALCGEALFPGESCITMESITQLCATCEKEDFFPISYQVEPSCDYIITMTSGSTGQPKPIVFTQETKLLRAYSATRDIYGLNEDSVVLTATPMHHSLAQRSVLLPLLLGGTGVILPKFSPAGWLEAVRKEKITFLFAVSNQLEILLEYNIGRPFDISSLKTIVSSSALLKDEVKQQLLNALPCAINECYGTSEIGVASDISINSRRDKLGSVGTPLPHVAIKVTDDARKTLLPYETGEIACKTITRFSRYYNNPNATANCFDSDGFFYTGDLGYLDNDGYLYYRGRKRDIVITGGINVHPQDIEEVLATAPGVAEGAVIGVEDSYFGEAVLAILAPKEGKQLDIAAVMQHCAGQLAEYQQPMAYEVLPKLPRNPMGKLMKDELRKQYSGYDATRNLRALMLGGREKKECE
ncbi:MAG: long-chain fatty acid--CoA ligase [Verrucomicrobiae bacterium]|nr:long-chain fatty acid--CoA ligase [Verrucomicrobiae bacterium]